MQKTKLYRAIVSLTKVEQNRLAKFALTQVPRVSSQLLLLLTDICKKESSPLSKLEVWQALGESGSFEDLRFRKICTDALQILEKFLSIEYYFSDPLQEASTRLMALGRHNMEPLYRTQLGRVETLMKRLPDQGAQYYYQKYQIEQHKYRMNQANLQRFEITNIEQILLNLDIFYVIEKLRYYCEILSRKTFVLHAYKNRLINEVLEIVDKDDLIAVPVVSIYHKIVLTHLYPAEDRYYYELKESVQKQAHFLPPEHRKEVFDSILNYCNRKINQGQKAFLRESFDHYQAVMKNELIYVDGLITHWTFKNVVVLALRLGEFSWAEQFIKKFSSRLEPSFRDNAVKYNLAQLYFYRKNFSEVLSLLQEVEYDDVSYNMGAKAMLLATYFELGEVEPLKALGDSFRVFLSRRRHTIPEVRRRSYLNLISLTLNLASIQPNDFKAMEQLTKKLDDFEVIASENWIREKVDEQMRINGQTITS